MRTSTLTILLLVSSASLVLAQQTSNEPAAKDILIVGELTHTLDAQKAKVGDPVILRLHDDVVSDGKIVVRHAKGKIVGHVSELQLLGKDDRQSKLAVTFDKIIGKEGRELPVSAVILQGIPPRARNSWDGSATVPTPGDEPVSRAVGGRILDSTVTPPHPPTSEAGPTTIAARASSGTDKVALSYDSAGQTTVMTSRKSSLKIEEGTLLTLRLKPLSAQP